MARDSWRRSARAHRRGSWYRALGRCGVPAQGPRPWRPRPTWPCWTRTLPADRPGNFCALTAFLGAPRQRNVLQAGKNFNFRRLRTWRAGSVPIFFMPRGVIFLYPRLSDRAVALPPFVIASGAKQSRRRRFLDCFATLAMTARGMGTVTLTRGGSNSNCRQPESDCPLRRGADQRQQISRSGGRNRRAAKRAAKPLSRAAPAPARRP